MASGSFRDISVEKIDMFRIIDRKSIGSMY